MTAGGRSIEILLVEDSPTDRLIAIEALQQARIINTLHVVDNGVHAMAYLRREGSFASARRPDLILLDLNLPKKDGREVLVEIKSDPLLKLIPVIVLTTSSAEEDVARAYGDHANSYITKPVDFPRFTRALDAIGTYWFEVVTLPPHVAPQRTAKQDHRATSSAPAPLDRQRIGVALLAADQRLVREVTDLLTDSAALRVELTVVGSVEALRAGQASDVLLVDLALGEGPEALRRARRIEPDAALLALVDDGEDGAGELALRGGAEDYILKSELDRPTMRRALRHAIRLQRMRQRLRRAQRLEAVGQLASGIAHDFNNLLTVLHGHAELLEDPEGDPLVQESVRGIKEASERATHLTRQLLTFSQRQTTRIEPVALNRVASDLSKMLRRVLGAEIPLVLQLDPGGPSALADVGMIEQVLLNLAINARAAMPGGGQLTVETGTAVLDPSTLERASQPDAYAGSFATLTVSDTASVSAPGYDPSIEGRSDPLATAENAEPGTGLGLSIVHGIVQMHRGWVQSERGAVGTRIQIFLPEASPARLDTTAHAPARAARGTETILLVEDESPVRQMTKTILARHGYQVLEARSGADALTTFDEAAGSIDLLFTDIVMPGGMTGPQLAEQLARRGASLKVIYTSGHGRAQIDPDLALTEGVDFLPKPYSSSRLLAIVRSALESKGAPG